MSNAVSNVKFFLVNTMDREAKRIISAHKTLEAAEKAQVKFDRSIRKSEGQRHYIPNCIVQSDEVRVYESFGSKFVNFI